MKNNIIVIAIVALLLGGGVGYVVGNNKSDSPHEHTTATSDKKTELANNMQKLWSDHMDWTYATVDAYFHEPDQLQSKLDRLLQNQKDIGAAIVPYYGQAAGDKLSALLTTHIQLAVPVLAAAKSGDNAGLNTALANWQANAKDIADFLSSANPDAWPVSATEPMMKEHIDTTVAYSVDLLKGNYEQSIKDFDKAYDHMMMMSQTLTTGIIAQYPNKF